MIRFFFLSLLFFLCVPILTAQAETTAKPSKKPTIELENRIAYQQGQFAALYARCGSPNDRALIGGSTASWKEKTFANYKGTPEERRHVEKTYEQAVKEVQQDPGACNEWGRQASATLSSIRQLAHYGEPVVLDRRAAW